MIDVYLTDAHGLGRREFFRTDDPVEAEARYLTLIRDHFGTNGGVWLVSDREDIALGHYALAPDWPGPCRERGDLRAAQIWGHPVPTAPTVAQIRALARISGLSRHDIAALAGYSKDAWDKWSAPADNAKARSMPWSAYFTAMVRAGLHPEVPWPKAASMRTFPTPDSHSG
ncbi:hypothetical protein GAY33_05340 [Azospirillum brasilense]|uniref:hypothetical protein n=1 Tax=Azospirillum argentinense TaxID=2970906 RepID=UPI00190DF887|nr:hypothetical protein [Azospirillum argentinense]MBK3798660.1 hypothetical protein [Azospirillum argentinense]